MIAPEGGMLWWIEGMSSMMKRQCQRHKEVPPLLLYLRKSVASTLIFLQEVLLAPAVEILQEIHSLAAISEASPESAC